MSMPVMSEVVLVGERRMSFVTWYCVGVHDATICVLVNYHNVDAGVDGSWCDYVFDHGLEDFGW